MWKFKSIRWKGHPNTKEHWWVNRKKQKPSWQKESAVRNQLFVLPEYTYYVLPIWTLPLAIFVNFFSKSCPSLSKKYLCNFECSVERRRRFNINDRIKELGGLLPTQVTNDGQLGVQQLTIFCTTINNWVSNNGWNLQSWTPIMVNNVPGWIKLCSFNFLIICSRVNRIMTWWGMFVRTRVRFWRWKKCWNCYCLFDNL